MLPEVYPLCTTSEHTFVLTLQPRSSTETQLARTLHESRMGLATVVVDVVEIVVVVVELLA